MFLNLKRSHFLRGVIISGLLIILLYADPAFANTWPPIAIQLIYTPLTVAIYTLGIGLIAIVIIESIILMRREHVSLLSALRYTLGANLLSTALGFLLAIGFGAPPLIPIYWGIFYACMVFMSIQSIPLLNLKRFPLWLSWGLLWLIILVGIIYLFIAISEINPATASGKPFPDWDVPFYINIIQLLLTVGFMAIGFFVSFCSEGFYLSKMLSKPTTSVLQTVWIMNLRSYVYVALPLTVFLMKYHKAI